MKIQNQVTSLELSKQINTLLKEKGMEVRESLFYWSNCCSYKKEYNIESSLWHDDRTGEWDDGHYLKEQENIYPAYTCSELGEMLPVNSTVEICRYNPFGKCCSMIWNNTEETHREYGDTEVEARGRMLVYLLSNNLLKSDEK